jgi:hypothetical protein
MLGAYHFMCYFVVMRYYYMHIYHLLCHLVFMCYNFVHIDRMGVPT